MLKTIVSHLNLFCVGLKHRRGYLLNFYLGVSFVFSSVLALQAVQVEVKFSTSAIRVEEDVQSVKLLAMRTENVELASIVR